MFGHSAIACIVLACAVTAVAAQKPEAGCDQVGEILGSRATAAGVVCRANLPRGDLDVSLLGARLPVGMGLTSWAAFVPDEKGRSLVMGDLVLTPSELPLVLSGLRENGLEATAVHRHMLGESPDIVFMHYMGEGSAPELAQRLRRSLDRAPSSLGRAPAARGEENGMVAGLSCTRIEEVLGVAPGSAAKGAGFCKVSMPRPEHEVTINGVMLPPGPTGIGSWFAFQETIDGSSAVIAGDMALLEHQVNAAITALRERGVDVVVLHNHMMGEAPRIVFFHFQARGEPLALAQTLRAGLDAAAGVTP